MTCLFYHGFYTDLPDQFVEANANTLKRWTENWSDNPYLVQSRIIDSVSVNLVGKPNRDRWPTLRCASQPMLKLWIHNKGANYNGGYWGALAEDQRDPDRVTGKPGGARAILTLADISRSYARAFQNPATGLVSFWDTELEKPKPPLKREVIIAGEITAYRCWRIENGWLRSVYQSDVWKPGCPLEGRELGDWDSRGIHAWKDAGSRHYREYIRGYLNAERDWMWRAFMGRERDDNQPAMVTGTVFLWGDVVEHERGYRAEFARVRSLDWLYPDETMMGREALALDDLRALYGVTDRRSACTSS